MEDYLPRVEVRVIDDEKGKGLFALRKFNPGDVIFEERPLVCAQFLWNQAYGYLACDYCMRPLETAEENVRRLTGIPDLHLPYPECCNTKKDDYIECSYCEVSYCNVHCREQAWEQYHQVLCTSSYLGNTQHPLDQLQNAWREMHYPPETASIMLIARMIATVKQAKDKAGAAHLFSQFCHKTRNGDIAHKLLGRHFQNQIEHLRQLMIKGLQDEDLLQWFTIDGFRSLIALVGTNGQGIGTSAFGVWVKNCDALDLAQDEKEKLNSFIHDLYKKIENETGPFLNNEGSGLYPLQSACNHSCVPNAEATFPYNNFTLVMEAIKEILPGEAMHQKSDLSCRYKTSLAI
ncbi:protein-lysine N-trimethyltransferase SMYD5 isoform X2 [Parasteatoda tepidariorum]|uniref:protein-lysine N-trimethyltransferase SMYD5 isoform X2 n=1 Tax=Parasteatoda tepidariorum TaxID=114398 RepID=UPI00077F9DA0|nr:SET and MYND domain-containing protein 5 isoform X2 [Parasteatoda tepidariorum]